MTTRQIRTITENHPLYVVEVYAESYSLSYAAEPAQTQGKGYSFSSKKTNMIKAWRKDTSELRPIDAELPNPKQSQSIP